MKFSEFNVEVASVHFEPSGREVRVVHETSLLDSVLQAGLGLGQSCDGVALCGFCRVQVVEGMGISLRWLRRNARFWRPNMPAITNAWRVARG